MPKELSLFNSKNKNDTDKKGTSSQRENKKIRVLSHKICSHTESVHLLTPHKSDTIRFVDTSSLFTKKERSCETDNRLSNDYLRRFLPYKLGSKSCKYADLTYPVSFLSKRVRVERDQKDQSSQLSQENSNNCVFLSLSSEVLSYNYCRERIRKVKLLSLKNSYNAIAGSDQHVLIKSNVSNKGRDQKGATIFSLSKKQYVGEGSKPVWKGFTNTLMRHGNKLRYQTVLRKALLTG